jgi:hypothetical protein
VGLISLCTGLVEFVGRLGQLKDGYFEFCHGLWNKPPSKGGLGAWNSNLIAAVTRPFCLFQASPYNEGGRT